MGFLVDFRLPRPTWPDRCTPPGAGEDHRSDAERLAGATDNEHAVPQRPALAHRLTEVLDVLAKGSQCRGKLAAARGLTRLP